MLSPAAEDGSGADAANRGAIPNCGLAAAITLSAKEDNMTKIIAQRLIQSMCFVVYSMEKANIDPSLIDGEGLGLDNEISEAIIQAHSQGAVAGQYTLVDTLHHQGLITQTDHDNAQTAFDLAREIAHNHMDSGRTSSTTFQAFWDDMMHEIHTRKGGADAATKEETNHVTGE